ncbi:MAG: hypothetical protein CMJ18_01275 [Phycisphaeraceae bacterium]|nr:hypothetical protein [Phycisphaeraceae bacterium]
MFHRRLVLLVVSACGLTGVLIVQTVHLTVAKGAQLRRRAERVLVRHELIETHRGSVFDRHQRLLAFDRPSYDIKVRFDVLTGRWAYRRARKAAARRADRLEWRRADLRRRLELTDQQQEQFDRQVRELWQTLCQLTGTRPDELESRRAAIVRRVHRYRLAHWKTRLRRWTGQEGEGAPRLKDVSHHAVREQHQSHIVIEDVDERARFAIQRMIAAPESDDVWGAVEIEFVTRRDRPWSTVEVAIDHGSLPSPLRRDEVATLTVEDVGRHVIGRMRPRLLKRQWEARPHQRRLETGEIVHDLGGYRIDDPIGATGIERSMEAQLRGRRGQATIYRDGRPSTRIDPVPGGDVVTTVDIALQARIQTMMDPGDPNAGRAGAGLMRAWPWHRRDGMRRGKPLPHVVIDGQPLCGAAVVLEIASGEVLAAVSTPWDRPDSIEDATDAAVAWDRINDPWRNRVVAKPYPPGSTMKPLILASAYTLGVISLGQQLDCAPGYLYPEAPTRYRCWIYNKADRPHDPMGGAWAIMQSCNMFFYRVGKLMGPERVGTWLGRFGLGAVRDAGMAEQVATHGARGTSERDAVLMAIGQGPVEWTVLQAADAYATLARGGAYRPPTFVQGRTIETTEDRDIRLDPRGVDIVLEGMRLAASDRRGTASRLRIEPGRPEPTFNLPGVEIFAKSGTAQAPDLQVSLAEGQPRETVRQGDHGWMICMAGRPGSSRPQYVIVVVVEFGGSGGYVAGPIANQVLHALRHEGYL